MTAEIRHLNELSLAVFAFVRFFARMESHVRLQVMVPGKSAKSKVKDHPAEFVILMNGSDFTKRGCNFNEWYPHKASYPYKSILCDNNLFREDSVRYDLEKSWRKDNVRSIAEILTFSDIPGTGKVFRPYVYVRDSATRAYIRRISGTLHT